MERCWRVSQQAREKAGYASVIERAVRRAPAPASGRGEAERRSEGKYIEKESICRRMSRRLTPPSACAAGGRSEA